MTVIIGMKNLVMRMAVRTLNSIEINISNQFIINKLIEGLDFFVRLNYYHSVQ